MMKQNPILITGGTGTVGSRIASRLIKLGYRVRIASRKKGALASAEYVYFDWKDASSFTPALEQVKDIYLVAPVGVLDPAPYVLPFLKEAKCLGAKRVVMQSASVVSENGPVFGALHQAVREFPEWTVLRPSYFSKISSMSSIACLFKRRAASQRLRVKENLGLLTLMTSQKQPSGL
ncbi:putative oxidoreductase YesF [Bacillus subtilis subsp. subtilis]|nr:putative oxidoreductase YesF [Bacillus subtilis subsp. subtilis]